MTPTRPGRHVINSLGRKLYVLDPDPRAGSLASSTGGAGSPSLAMWRRLVSSQPWDLVVDAQARYGEMLLGVDTPPGAAVIGFESDPQLRSCLVGSIADAGVDVEVRDHSIAGSEADPTATTLSAALLDVDARSACIRIDVDGAEGVVLRGGETFFRSVADVAIHVSVLHRDPRELALWSREWRMYLYDVRRDGFVRVGRRGVDDVRHLLLQPWIHQEDAILRTPVAL